MDSLHRSNYNHNSNCSDILRVSSYVYLIRALKPSEETYELKIVLQRLPHVNLSKNIDLCYVPNKTSLIKYYVILLKKT